MLLDDTLFLSKNNILDKNTLYTMKFLEYSYNEEMKEELLEKEVNKLYLYNIHFSRISFIYYLSNL